MIVEVLYAMILNTVELCHRFIFAYISLDSVTSSVGAACNPRAAIIFSERHKQGRPILEEVR